VVSTPAQPAAFRTSPVRSCTRSYKARTRATASRPRPHLPTRHSVMNTHTQNILFTVVCLGVDDVRCCGRCGLVRFQDVTTWPHVEGPSKRGSRLVNIKSMANKYFETSGASGIHCVCSASVRRRARCDGVACGGQRIFRQGRNAPFSSGQA